MFVYSQFIGDNGSAVGMRLLVAEPSEVKRKSDHDRTTNNRIGNAFGVCPYDIMTLL